MQPAPLHGGCITARIWFRRLVAVKGTVQASRRLKGARISTWRKSIIGSTRNQRGMEVLRRLTINCIEIEALGRKRIA